MKTLATATLSLVWIAGRAASGADDVSTVRSDERVVFFPTHAALADDVSAWDIPVHGWIFEPEEDSFFRSLTISNLSWLPKISREHVRNPIFQKRVRAFFVDNERGKRLAILVGERAHVLNPSASNGHFSGRVKLPASEARKILRSQDGKSKLPRDGWLHFQLKLRAGDSRLYMGSVQLLSPGGLSVISDIDDTIKITGVTDKEQLIKKTFLEEFQAVDGMPALYGALAAKGAAFHYVSSSPWQLYRPLSAFRREAGFPAGSFHLKTFRMKDSSFFELFASAEKTKPRMIEPILRAFPKRRFVLIGDAGEKDPEVYGAIARSFPTQVVRILIREVPGADLSEGRFAEAFLDLPQERWQVFKHAKDVKLGD